MTLTPAIYALAITTCRKVLEASNDEGCSVVVDAPAAAGVSQDAELQLREFNDRGKRWAKYVPQIAELLGSELSYVRLFDLSIICDDQSVQPAEQVAVQMKLDDVSELGNDVHVVHIGDNGPESVDASLSEGTVSFEASGFSMYAVVSTTLEEQVLTSDGQTYQVSVTYGSDAAIPEGAALEVREILPEEDTTDTTSSSYAAYVAKTEQALGWETGSITSARIFDISIVSNGVHVQPQGQVAVRVELEGEEVPADASVVHFADGAETGDVIADASVEGAVVSFSAESFSVYTITTDFTTPTYESPATSLETGVAYRFANNNGGTRYVTNSEYTAANPHGLGKTANMRDASLFYLEEAEGDNNYYVYTYVDDVKKYVTFEYLDANNSHVKLSDEKPGLPLTITVNHAASGVYFIAGHDDDGKGNTKTWYLNQHAGTSGYRFAGWHNADNGSKIAITIPTELENDALGLDGKSYGIVNHKSDISGYAMMEDAFNSSRLQRKELLIKEDPLDHDGRCFIAQDADITMWTFHAVEGDVYYLTAEVDGVTKFLNVQASGLTLVDDYDENCNITVVPGTGGNAGKLQFLANDGSVVRMHENAATNGFGTTTATTNANDWFNLVEESDLTDEDFVAYRADKVSVSDTTNVANGKQVVVYTRTWNDTTKAYEYYAIDHDGSLVRVYESGDTIEWVGTQVNSLLWDFKEYYKEDGTTPSYYYDLQNAYSGQYLAPQISGDQLLSDDPAKLNLNGRRYEEYATTILAWDDPDYQYSGFKVEDGQLVPCRMSEADDFYFAVMEKTESELTTVETVDNNDYGITMKMQDYNGTKSTGGSYDATQTDVMGSTGNDKGLVNAYLEDDGYPLATKTGTSLSTLFDEAYEVNHLFNASTYNESGYFEYNCTENFAHLVVDEDDPWIEEGYNVGDFVVYGQVGTIETNNPSLSHGQFMPYNDLEEGVFSQRYTNDTDETDTPLSYDDPRKDMPLYTIPYNWNTGEGVNNNANYHFGMEMEASFTQTAGGVDAWGHDIIFEFAGDDDMFFYVDGVLILDLGGNHKALTGKVNFRTGQVTSSRGNSNLRDLFKASYKAQHPDATNDEVNDWLKTIFEVDSKGNITTVFTDYSTHTMRMIYMERGAGASNLHMRFNLAAVKPGTVQLSKALSGVENQDDVLAEYPYQILYKTQQDGESTWHVLGAETGEPDYVKYLGSTRSVTYQASYEVTGVENPYEHVFLLKPGETAEITMPDDVTEYKIIECGVNPNVYDEVKVNDTVVDGTNYGTVTTQGSKKDYETTAAAVDDRQTVVYDNHVKPEALRTFSFTKELYDVSGERIYHNTDATGFDFRLYLCGENDDEPTATNMQAYCVKDDKGNYCQWDSDAGTFASLGVTSYDELTDDQKEPATFHTSINGAISRIPVDYTVEVRQVLVGTQFKVIEHEDEVPKGYSWKAYQLNGEDVEATEAEGVSGVMPGDTSEPDPTATVQNYKGWGFTVDKIWTDSDFMASHDPIYFAVFTQEGDELTLVDGTVREMPDGTTSLYWYFDKLHNNASFGNHVVREVVLSGDFTVDDKGVVTGYDSATPVGEGETLTVEATPIVDATKASFTYTASYEQGEIGSTDDNIREDTTTNARPSVRIVKTAWDGTPLAGTTFTLTGENGTTVGQDSYVSDSDGLVTRAYLPEGTFVLTETAATAGYTGLSAALTITKAADGTIALSGAEADEGLYTYTAATEDEDATITIKNRPFTLEAVKVGADENEPLEGVHFALYRQVTSSAGNPIKDYNPLSGYEDLVTGADGVIPRVTQALKAGTYYLTETQALDAYVPLAEDICFTISATGSVTVVDSTKSGNEWALTSVTDDDGTVAYTLQIKNSVAYQHLRIKKVDIAAWSTSALADATFDLYAVEDGAQASEALYTGLRSGSDGLLVHEDETLLELPVGVYHLVETAAPDGYTPKTSPVVITVTSTNVTYDEGTSLSQSGKGRQYDATSDVYTLLVSNSAGYVLPSTGGPGMEGIRVLGCLVVAAAGLFLARSRRQCA